MEQQFVPKVAPFKYRMGQRINDPKHPLNGAYGYWITLFCIYDGNAVYTFYSMAECFENAALAREAGFDVYTFQHEILVSRFQFPDKYKQILDFEGVFEADLDR